jgi:SAM-dependent methyltransferase
MNTQLDLEKIRRFWAEKLARYGATPLGMDWNSETSQVTRFVQLCKLWNPAEEFSILDYGCGYGALIDFLDSQGMNFRYTGYDLLESMVAEAQRLHADHPNCTFIQQESSLEAVDYTVSSGIFNKRLDIPDEDWLAYVLSTLHRFNELSRSGFAFNMLTRYSDPERMGAELYYADPLVIFDYCKTHFARNVALLHNYNLYDFTILVHKNP